MRCRRLLTIIPIALVACVGLAVTPASAAIGVQVPLTQVTAWGSAGSGNGQFGTAVDVAVDPATGNVYATDVGNDRVQRFTTDGAFLGTFNRFGTSPRSLTLQEPRAIAVGGGSVYVQDTELDQVARFSLTGTFLNRWNVPEQGTTTVGQVRPDLATDVAGNVYVLSGGATVQKYSPTGALLQTLAGGSGFNMGIAVASNGDILVAGLNGDITRHSPAGVAISSFHAANTFISSLGIDAAGNIWTVDFANHVLSFTPSGDLRATAGAGTGATPQFTSATSVAVSTTPDTVYVTDAQRVVKVGRATRLILTYETDGDGDVDVTFIVSGPGPTQTFVVDDDATPTLSNTAVASALALGTWHVELTNTPQNVKTITCSNGVQTLDYSANAVDITLGVGETVSCEFYSEWIG